MFFIIRNEEKLSIKTCFITQLLNLNSKNKVFYVFKKNSEKFKEKWSRDQVLLPFSVKGLIVYFAHIMLKSPRDLRNGLMVRLSLINRKHVINEEGFLSTLSRTLNLFFGTSARSNRLFHLINRLDSPKVFLIDEFLSLTCIDLAKLRRYGPIIYVSQDLAYNRFGFGDNFITRQLMFRLERDALVNIDLVIACSERERLKYLEMGARQTMFYPNSYPTNEFEPIEKDKNPSICIVLKNYWGSRAKNSLKSIFKGLGCLSGTIRVYLIGIKPQEVPKNIILEHSEFIPNKLDYLRVLSRSWIGINVGIHSAGTNERKYDYAEAGTIVFSDNLGVRGDLLPFEYTYLDSHDLAAKISQLLKFDRKSLVEMGLKNRKHVLSMTQKERYKLLAKISGITI